MANCLICIHKPVCDLWRENECQDASCFSLGSCDCYETGKGCIVHCKDCYYQSYDVDCGSECRLHHSGIMLDEDYCSRGIPKEAET